MKISVVICSYNRRDLVADVLKSMTGCTPPTSADAEIVVVDNGSTDGTESRVLQRAVGHPFPVRCVRVVLVDDVDAPEVRIAFQPVSE